MVQIIKIWVKLKKIFLWKSLKKKKLKITPKMKMSKKLQNLNPYLLIDIYAKNDQIHIIAKNLDSQSSKIFQKILIF